MVKLDNVMSSDSFRPSDYTAALVQSILKHASWAESAQVLDVGCGSGVLLAAAGSAGAAHLCGVDIEAGAVATTETLLRSLCPSSGQEVHLGEMFGPVAGRRFDLVLANLPHFPMAEAAVEGRLASWSAGGPDGRRLLDRFICGLPACLAPGGHALLMHNDFIGLDHTRAAAADQGLTVAVVQKIMVPLPKAKLAVMTPEVLERETGQSIRRFGDYAFGSVSVLALDHAGTGDGRS